MNPSPDDRLPADLSDHSLLLRLQRGEEDAATALYLRYAKRLQRLARAQTAHDLAPRLDPEDVVQSVFRTFFRRATAGDYELPEGEELWKLFLVISLNKIRALAAFHRALKRDVRATARLDPAALAEGLSNGRDDEAFRVLRMTIDELFQELPTPQRHIVVLRIEGHDVATIGRQTRRSKRTVERVLQNFRNRLGQLIQEENVDAGDDANRSATRP